MALIAGGEIILVYSRTLVLFLFGMCIVYMGQAVAGCTIAAIMSVLATDSNRGAVVSMLLTAQVLGRVVGPVVLSSLFCMHPAWPYACASVSSIVCSFSAAWAARFEKGLLIVLMSSLCPQLQLGLTRL